MELEKKAALSVDIVPWYSREKARGTLSSPPNLYFGGKAGKTEGGGMHREPSAGQLRWSVDRRASRFLLRMIHIRG